MVSSVFVCALRNKDQSHHVSVSVLAKLLFFKITFSLNKDLPSTEFRMLYYTPEAWVSEVRTLEWWKTRRPGYCGSHPFLVYFSAICLMAESPSVYRVLRSWQHSSLPCFWASLSHDKDVCNALAYLSP